MVKLLRRALLRSDHASCVTAESIGTTQILATPKRESTEVDTGEKKRA
jgi:hypothetical protein